MFAYLPAKIAFLPAILALLLAFIRISTIYISLYYQLQIATLPANSRRSTYFFFCNVIDFKNFYRKTEMLTVFNPF